MSKTFLFQTIQFNQTVLIQLIQFSISTDFVYTKLNAKTVLCSTIQFSVNTVSMLKTGLFHIIQFGISTQFMYGLLDENISISSYSVSSNSSVKHKYVVSSIESIDRVLSGATTTGKSGPGSDGNKDVLRIPQSSSITGTSPSDCLVSYPGHSLVGNLTSPQRCSQCILQPQPTGQCNMECDHHHVALVARISLTLSRHSSLSFIALGRSSGQHLVSSHSC